MKVFLLDTNIWSHWYRKTDYTIANIAALKGEEHRLMMSPVSWGEFAYGWALDKTFPRHEFMAFLDSISFQFCKDMDKHTAMIYGELRALLRAC